MRYKIYKITNKINGKVYIGFTRRDIQRRFSEHCNRPAKTSYISYAIKKYGANNFEIELIEESDDLDYLLGQREDYWINYYNSRDNRFGYNLVKGGTSSQSTKDTVIYNNGIHQKFIKIGQEVPSGYVKGPLPTTILTRYKVSKHRRNKNKNSIPWNKGKSIKVDSKTTVESQILKGANNPRAKTFIVIDPSGKEYIITGTIKEFCKSMNISYVTLRSFKDKGPVKDRPKSCTSDLSKNAVGWSIKTVDVDSVEEAKKARLKTRYSLLSRNKLTRRQKTISKFFNQ